MIQSESMFRASVFFLSGILVGTSLKLIYHQHSRKYKKRPKDAAIETELATEQFSRIASFFGDAEFRKLKDAFVIVVGLGGVGSHCASMLARSGVQRLRLIDFDNVTLSSLNRHAVATRDDVGVPKVQATKEHLLQIVPTCTIDAIPLMFDEDSAETLLDGQPTYVVDCIDDVNTKAALLQAAVERRLNVITATGAGAKADPTRICIGNLTDALRDPLATKIRYFLRKRKIDPSKITTVYSSELPRCQLLPLNEAQSEEPSAFGNVENFRVRVIPVLGTMPALFGQSLAAYVLTDICGQQIKPEAVPRLTRELRNKLYHKLVQREAKISEGEKVPIDRDDIEYIVNGVWKARCAITGKRLGGRDRMILSRWRKELPLTPANIVLLTTAEAKVLDENGIEGFDAPIVSRVDARLQENGSWAI